MEGGIGRKETVLHGILCALALSKKKKEIFKDLEREEDCHHALVECIKKDPSESAAKTVVLIHQIRQPQCQHNLLQYLEKKVCGSKRQRGRL